MANSRRCDGVTTVLGQLLLHRGIAVFFLSGQQKVIH